ncbi:serine hydrolase [Legionella sp. PC997]|uniref:serine hydrolase domain-containing protein n=1 Tax=Legionella sp. PC997 TaxID=2755562 RepID=UPI001862A046|nr:serine hydrolase domain-containing protein [Legionella sp. PC997]QMT60535.1 hypothetical protein HBNCFIEN_01908 [Legionella sp. PC997]
MQQGGITGASFATVDSKGDITPIPVGNILDHDVQSEVKEDTLFQCASLSKPVFAYLVLKLLEVNKTNNEEDWPGKFKTDFDLETPLYSVFKDKGKVLEGDNNPFLKQFSDQEQAKQLTAEMVLSHTTGLPIVASPPYQFQFKPGTSYAYSGPGIECLQIAIEELTGINLEKLAQEHVFGPLKMSKSTYGPEGIAANSLKTTAEEYAKFITAWINDDKLNYAFDPVAPADSMNNDFFPNPTSIGKLVEKIEIDNKDRDLVAWGLGIGLVKNNQGQIIGAYHTGDMGNNIAEFRSGVGAVIDPLSKHCVEATVYLTKSPNGHILADEILPSILKPGLDYFFPTYGFARNADELDGTNFHGMNPRLLKSELKEMAYKTKTPTPTLEPILQSVEHPSKLAKERVSESTDSTQKMFHQMNVTPLLTKPVPSAKNTKSEEKEVDSVKQDQKIEQKEEDKIQEDQVFNPTPLSTSFDPYKT